MKRMIWALALALTACGGQPATQTRPAASDEMNVEAHVQLTMDEGAPLTDQGRLVFAWIPMEMAQVWLAQGRPPAASLMTLIAHTQTITVAPDKLLQGHTAHLSLPSDARNAHLMALLEMRGGFWGTLLSGGPLMALSKAPLSEGAPTLTLHARAPKVRKPTPHCEGPRFRPLVLGPEPGARACVHLPKGYTEEEARYPVVYLLPGLTGDDMTRFHGSGFTDQMDALTTKIGQKVILVGVNTRSAAGSAYARPNQPGGPLPYLDTLVKTVDDTFRTVPHSKGRILMGQSTGGFNAISVALIWPGVFGAVGASGPDGLDLRSWLLKPDGTFEEQWFAWLRLEAALTGPGQFVSYAVAWSPDAEGKPRWPVDPQTGAVNPEVMALWMAHNPTGIVQTPTGQKAMRDLEGRIYLGVARGDEFDLYAPTQTFADQLSALGIEHTLKVDDSSHFDANDRLVKLIALALDALSGPQKSTADATP
ncbi:MAG: alpha/beta hydrolase-fold protein [Bradymonadia bacterium]